MNRRRNVEQKRGAACRRGHAPAAPTPLPCSQSHSDPASAALSCGNPLPNARCRCRCLTPAAAAPHWVPPTAPTHPHQATLPPANASAPCRSLPQSPSPCRQRRSVRTYRQEGRQAVWAGELATWAAVRHSHGGTAAAAAAAAPRLAAAPATVTHLTNTMPLVAIRSVLQYCMPLKRAISACRRSRVRRQAAAASAQRQQHTCNSGSSGAAAHSSGAADVGGTSSNHTTSEGSCADDGR